MRGSKEKDITQKALEMYNDVFADARPGQSCFGRYVGTRDPCNSTNCDDSCRVENKEEPLCQGRCSLQMAKCRPIGCLCKFCRFP